MTKRSLTMAAAAAGLVLLIAGVALFCVYGPFAAPLSEPELKKQLESDNPGFTLFDLHIGFVRLKGNDYSAVVRPTQQGKYNYLSVFHRHELKDLSALKRSPIRYLSLYDSGVRDLSVLKDVRDLEFLHLGGNRELKDFNFLKALKLRMLHITDSPAFSDTTLIPPTVTALILDRTGVTELKLQDPANIKVLTLTGSGGLKNAAQIGEMKNLQVLTLSSWEGISLERLGKLKSVGFDRSPITELPVMPQKNFELVSVFKCDALKSIAPLRGKKLRHLWLMGENIARFLPEILDLDVEVLVIGDRTITAEDPLVKKIAAKVKNLHLNSSVVERQ